MNYFYYLFELLRVTILGGFFIAALVFFILLAGEVLEGWRSELREMKCPKN